MTRDYEVVDVEEALTALEEGAFLLDVREDDEWAAGRAPDAVHIVLGELPDRFDEIPRDRAILCVCRVGGRSGRAASFLAEAGYIALNLDGGMQAWAASELPLVGDEGTARII